MITPMSFFIKEYIGSREDRLRLIWRKKRPLMICGGGVRYSEAADAFRGFAEKFNIPFCETQAGKSAITWEHPLNLGGIGATGNLAANTIAKQADLVIGAGTRYTDFTTSSKWIFQNPKVAFVNINIAPFDTYKLDAVRITADARAALDELSEALEGIGYRSSYTSEIQTAKKQWEAECGRLFSVQYHAGPFKPEIAGQIDHVLPEFGERTGSYLTQTGVLGVLAEILPEDAIVVGASGSLPGDGCIDFDGIFDILSRYSYKGWMVVEAEQDPAVANPLEYALKARKYIKEKTGL